MLPLMVLSTLGVILFSSLSQGLSFSASSLLGLSSSDSLSSEEEGNIDLTRREGGRDSLPAPVFTAYGSPTAPSYSSYTYTGPPSATALASLGRRKEREELYDEEQEQEQEQEVGEEGSLVSWLAVPALVVLGLLFLPTAIPGSGLVTSALLQTISLDLQNESRSLQSSSRIMEAIMGREEEDSSLQAREDTSLTLPLALPALALLGLMLVPSSVPGEAWSPLSNLAWRLSTSLANSMEGRQGRQATDGGLIQGREWEEDQ